MSEMTSLQTGPGRVSEWSILDDLGQLQGWMRPTTLLEVRNRLEADLVRFLPIFALLLAEMYYEHSGLGTCSAAWRS